MKVVKSKFVQHECSEDAVGKPNCLLLYLLFNFFYLSKFMNASFRTSLSIVALAVASLTLPSLAHAKRMGGGGMKSAPRTATPAPAKAPAAAAPAPAATPAAAAAPAAARPGMMGTVGAVAAGAVIGSVAGSAIAGGMNPEEKQKAAAEKAAAAASAPAAVK